MTYGESVACLFHAKLPKNKQGDYLGNRRTRLRQQSASAVILGKFMSVEGIARVALRQTGEQAAGLGLVLVAER